MSRKYSILFLSITLVLGLVRCEPMDSTLDSDQSEVRTKPVVYEGNLKLTSQVEVDAAAGYTVVTGYVDISGNDIYDLSALSSITTIGSYLTVTDNPALVKVVDGFSSLEEVTGIYFYNNDNLTEFAGFSKLLQSLDNIDFWYNASLVSITGFESLHTAGWSLEFGGNPLLTTIPRFESLKTINSSLFILDNTSLAEITGLRALQYVDWSFSIEGNLSLASLCGFHNYFTANNPYSGGGTFAISNNGPTLPEPTTMADVINAGRCVLSPVEALEDLLNLVVSMDVASGATKRLVRILHDAMAQIDCDNSCDISNTIATLEEFKGLIERYRNKQLSADQADRLLNEADFIIDLLM